MRVLEAKTQITRLISAQLEQDQFAKTINLASPDLGDIGKFSLLDQPARAIHRYSGWHIPINLSWFSGSLDLPEIKNGEFYWYAIAIPKYSGFTKPHYFICDYAQMREWALDFDAPLGNHHQDHNDWRADVELYEHGQSEKVGYFRWGDEPHRVHNRLSRIMKLDNINEILAQRSFIPPGHRIVTEVSRIVRDTSIVRQLKDLYANKCQICGIVLGLPGSQYSEAHHVRPLGQPHNGPDITKNILILCPNHHAEFDLGYVAVDPDSMTIIHVDPHNQFNACELHIAASHDLAPEFLSYHKKNRFGHFPE
jgi:HNH endonuclease